MEKSEMMKLYEEKMDLKKDSIKMQYVYDRFIEGFEEFAQEEYDALQNENTRLKQQFTWLSAKKPPDVDGLYMVTKRDECPRWDKTYHLVRFKNGKWELDCLEGGYVHSYFNVPIPAPEGEVK